jgi:hypothetical protein
MNDEATASVAGLARRRNLDRRGARVLGADE